MGMSYRLQLAATCADPRCEPTPRITSDSAGKITIHLRPIGQGLVAHRQGHRVREQIGLRLVLSRSALGLHETEIRAEFFDIPAHLYRPDRTVAFGSRFQAGLTDLIEESLGIEVSGYLYPPNNGVLEPDIENPEIVVYESAITDDIFDLLAKKQVSPD